MARRLKQTWPKARVLVFSILPRGADFQEFDAKRRAANALTARHALGDGYVFISADDAMACGFKPAGCSNYKQDWIHPNEQGDQILTRYILRAMPS